MPPNPDTPPLVGEQGDLNTTPARQKYWQRNLDDETRRWFEADNRYFLHQSLSTPVLNVIAGTDGIYIQELNGKRSIDMHGNGVHNAGFNNPSVVQALKKQLDSGLTFCPRRYTNIPAIRLARKLARITPPGLCRSLFCPGGSEAIEMALQLARQVTGRYKTLSFWDSFHGAGFAAAGIGGEAHFKGGLGPMLPGALHVEFPNYYRNPWGFRRPQDVDAECLRQMEVILQREPDIGAVVAEPISATPIIPSPDYWQGVKALCERHGMLLIFDEIIEGLGRTGKMFASEHYVTPDVLVLGKSLGGGMLPFAAMVTHEKYNTCRQRSIGHYTHEKNALCAVAALAEIEYLEQHAVCQHAALLGVYTLNQLKQMQARHRLIGDVRGVGLHLGIELVRDRDTRQRALIESEAVMFKCLERGLSFKTIEGNVITWRPALTITQAQMDRALEILDVSLTEVENGELY